MKLGFVSAILDGWAFEEMIDTAAAMGFACVEAACWPRGKAERRYAGVSHIDAENLGAEQSAYLLEYCRSRGVTISALAYYPNPMDPDLKKRAASIAHLKAVIDASARLHVNLVATFIGRDQTKTVAENLRLFETVWPDLIRYAEDRGVKVAIENCPMLFGEDQWPGGQNLAATPMLWEEMFSRIPSPNFGLNYDPSHLIWQMMDYIQPIYAFRERLFHVHFKDIKVYKDRLNRVGSMAYPLEYMAPKLPGLGDVDWGRFISALTDIGYDGCGCIEVEDRAFEGSRSRVLDSLRLSKRYMEQFVI